jgi:hypothetical protein
VRPLHTGVVLVRDPQAGVVPDEVFAAQGRSAIVCRRELSPESDGLDGFVYVIASCPRIIMSYRKSAAADGGALEGKPAADAYLKAMAQLA